MPEIAGVAQPRLSAAGCCSAVVALCAKQQHRALDVLLPAGEAGIDCQLLELIRIGRMKEKPAAAEPGSPHTPAQAGVGDHDVAPELAARLQNAVELPHGGVLVGKHM